MVVLFIQCKKVLVIKLHRCLAVDTFSLCLYTSKCAQREKQTHLLVRVCQQCAAMPAGALQGDGSCSKPNQQQYTRVLNDIGKLSGRRNGNVSPGLRTRRDLRRLPSLLSVFDILPSYLNLHQCDLWKPRAAHWTDKALLFARGCKKNGSGTNNSGNLAARCCFHVCWFWLHCVFSCAVCCASLTLCPCQ